MGLKKDFKGIFHNSDLNQAIEHLKSDEQDFSFIIELLENTSADYGERLVQSLYEVGTSQDEDFEEHFKFRLQEIKETDGQTNQTQSRKEQGILRGILFKGVPEAKCAICHRNFPTDIMVAAHIKPRSKCSTQERKNPNVVMPVCKVGCDDLFEKGECAPAWRDGLDAILKKGNLHVYHDVGLDPYVDDYIALRILNAARAASNGGSPEEELLNHPAGVDAMEVDKGETKENNVDGDLSGGRKRRRKSKRKRRKRRKSKRRK